MDRKVITGSAMRLPAKGDDVQSGEGDHFS